MGGIQGHTRETSNNQRSRLLLECAQERRLLLDGLERAVTELARGVDELERNLLEIPAAGVDHEGLAEGDDALLGSGDRALEDNEVVLDDTVVGEATERGDDLLGHVRLGRCVGRVVALANAVDLLVELRAVMVTVCTKRSACNMEKRGGKVRTLTSTGNREHDLGRMPCTNAGNLTETLVSLARQLAGAPTMGSTLETVTPGDGNDIDDLVLLEDRVDVDGLLEQAVCVLDLVCDAATVDLDLHKVGLLLLEASLADLGVGKHTDDSSVLADTLELACNRLAAICGRVLCVAGERLLLGAVPVLIEPTLKLVREMRSPDGGERAETAGSLDVANNTNSDQRGRLDNRNSLHDLLTVHLCGLARR